MKRAEVTYRYVDGPLAGRAADLLFGDRVAVDPRPTWRAPLHRDLRGLADVAGFDRARLVRRTDEALLAELRFGDRLSRRCSRPAARRSRSAASPEGARRATPSRPRAGAAGAAAAGAPGDARRGDRGAGRGAPLRSARGGEDRRARRRAAARLAERLPAGARELRVPGRRATRSSTPTARRGRREVCVDFVLDSFERTSGTWFAPRGGPARRGCAGASTSTRRASPTAAA